MFKIISNHKTAVIVLGVLFLGGGYYWYNYINVAPIATRYVLAKAEKGMLISSISGSGQVSSSDQVDVKSKVSGDLIWVNAVKDQEVKEGAILAQIDSRDALRAVSDAEIALESAKIKLEELFAPLDAQTLLKAENALSQAQRNLEKAETVYKNIDADNESVLASAYEDGYSQVSTALFKLSDYMADLKGVRGIDKNKSESEYMTDYRVILGENSLFIKKFNDDFSIANDLYLKNSVAFVGVFRDSSRDTIYATIINTLETTKAISQSLESARHMYDAMVIQGYTGYTIASVVDKMQPKIESDLSSVFSNISTLQKTIDTIDSTVEDTPDKIKDAELAFNSAKESLNEKQLALEELKKGVSSLDIRTQENTVAQKEAALVTAKEKLSSYYIRAPFDGIAIEANVKKGDAVSSSTVIATIVTKQKIIEISLNEIDIVKIKIGQKATVAFDAIEDFTVAGDVVEIDSAGAVSQGVVSYGIKIAFNTEDDLVKPGMSVSVAIIIDAKQDALLVPNSAVKLQGGVSYVEIADGDIPNSSGSTASGVVLTSAPRNQTVETGLSNDTMIEIISGLNEGDNVITRAITAATQTAATTQSSGLRIPGLTGGGGMGGR
ncbi:MAG: efflux RND transporter periplasmic adaptor subunit [Patescibacteria group bacterium]